MTRSTGYNSTYPKVAVQWLNQALCLYQNLCLVDSEVLRNRHLRVAAKRYQQYYRDSSTINYMKLIALKNLDDSKQFYKGSRFRIYNIGLNVEKKDDDFYEYILVENPSDKTNMILVNIEGQKSGSVLCYVKIHNKDKYFVNCSALKFSIGLKNTFYIET